MSTTIDTDTAERSALRAAVRDVLGDLATSEQVRAALGDPVACGSGSSLWKALVSLGLPALHVDAAIGGQGGTPGDLAAALEECGAALAPSPLLSVALATSLIVATGHAVGPELVARSSAGEVVTFALAERGGTWTSRPTTKASEGADGWTLQGTKAYVTDPEQAWLVVSAETPTGTGLFLVSPDAAVIASDEALDLLRPLGSVTFENTPAVRLDAGDDVSAVLDRWTREAAVLLAAEQVGVARACLELAVDYAKTRVQFGRPIGSFQAIKHMCADMLLQVEGARSLLWSSCEALDAGRQDEETELICATTAAYCSDAAVEVSQACLQVHGGIGFTWEHSCHLYLRRAKADEVFLGSPEDWRERAVRVLEAQIANGD